MNLPFDKIIVSCDDNPKFLNFWPIVSKAWKKFFPDVMVDFCLVTDEPKKFIWVEKYGSVFYYKKINDVPVGNLGKVCRLYHAAQQNNLVCSIHDIDSIPLQRNYLFDLLSLRKKNHYCLIGGEYYLDEHLGKAPMVPTTSEGYIFNKLLKCNDKTWEEFIESIKNIQIFDLKESILASSDPVLYPNNHFSDESLVRAFMKNFDGNIQWMRRDQVRPLNPFEDWIDRSYRNFTYDKNKLYSGFYTECNMIRPFNHELMKEILDYVSI